MKALFCLGCLVPVLFLTASADHHEVGEKSDLSTPLAPNQWVSAGNSVLTITNVGPYGQFTGTYVNGETTSFPCATESDTFQVEGQFHATAPSMGNNITFAVNWTNVTTDCDSVTRWSGVVSTSGDTITTNWVLAMDGSTNAIVGSDVFTRE
ncbi:MAG: avidin/streptavidin family protein [Sphingomonadales bacterium]|jgi:hypothetical protein